jgi:hypothetical protein
MCSDCGCPAEGLKHSAGLADADWDCARILQQLPVNTLTSQDLSLDIPGKYVQYDYAQQLAGVMAVLPRLQQLRKLVLMVEDSNGTPQNVDPLLEPLSGLTNLTSLEVGTLWSLR